MHGTPKMCAISNHVLKYRKPIQRKKNHQKRKENTFLRKYGKLNNKTLWIKFKKIIERKTELLFFALQFIVAIVFAPF